MSIGSDEGSGERSFEDDLSPEDSPVTRREVGVGFVGFKNNIPDEEFEKMISGDLDPWESHDQSHDQSHDNDNVHTADDDNGLESHDIKDQSHDIAQDQRQISHDGSNKLIALILAPTRELAIQVHDHLRAVTKYTNIKVRRF